MNARKKSDSTATLEALGSGRFKVRGTLNADTVTGLLERSEAAFRGTGSLEFDLAEVPDGDSAGLALLIEWLRLGKQHQRTVQFENVPEQIAALARISEVETLLNGNGAVR